ncbi:MAG: AMP-binding protein, partial [Alphaproteobacteria bacterium]|nr:AMP-binding protein [Alphaproteobacteria bacterium]
MGMMAERAEWSAEASGMTLSTLTIGGMLDERANSHRDRDALIFRAPESGIDRSWTYAQLREEADRYARALIALGVGKGDKVAILSPNSPDWIILEYALAKTGAVLVTVNPAYRESELRYLLGNGDVHTLIFISQFRGFDVADLMDRLVPQHNKGADSSGGIRSPEFPALRNLVCMDGNDMRFMSMADLLALAPRCTPQELNGRHASVS